MRKLGFTGTRRTLKKLQLIALGVYFHHQYGDEHIELHHGDCVGGDETAHILVASCPWCRTHIHPPKAAVYRAFCDGDKVYEQKEYLERNHDIVRATDMLIATPKEFEEVLRSGTWATIRFARKVGKDVVIIYPDGTTKIERNQ